MEIKKDYNMALKFAYQCGAEKVANPGNPDCNVRESQSGFASYAGSNSFNDLTLEQQKDFFREWQRGIKDEKKLCGLA